MVEAIEDLVGGFIGATRQKELHFLKWACLTYFILKQAVLTHDVYKPGVLLRMTSRLIKYLLGRSHGWKRHVLWDLCSYSMGIRNVIGTH